MPENPYKTVDAQGDIVADTGQFGGGPAPAPTPAGGGYSPAADAALYAANDAKYAAAAAAPPVVQPVLPALSPALAPPPINPYSSPRELYPITPPDQAASEYESSAIRGAQGRIDAIGARYDAQLKSELATSAAANAPAALEASQRTNALSALMGLSGSSAADSRAQASTQASAKIQTTQNAAITDKVQLQKMTQLNAIYDRIDANAQAIYKSQLDTNATNKNLNIEAEKANKLAVAKNAVGLFAHLAAQYEKVNFDDFMSAHQNDATVSANIQAALDAGYSLYDLRESWDKGMPEENRKKVGEWQLTQGPNGEGIMTRLIYDPTKGKPTTETYDSGLSYEAQAQPKLVNNADGSITALYPNGTWKEVKPMSDLEKQSQEADLAYKKAQTSKLYADINNSGPGRELKKVTIDGKDYMQDAQGNLSLPNVPDALTPEDTILKYDTIIKNIDSLLDDADLNKAVGSKSSQVPQWMRSGARNAVDSKIANLIAKVAIENLGWLKGPLSDKDIQFVKEASTKLNTNVSEEAFRKFLKDLKTSTQNLKNKGGGVGSSASSEEQQMLDAGYTQEQINILKGK